MARITRDEVERIADLARLSLSDAEAAVMTADLEAILDHVAELQAVDTRDVEPTSHAIPISAPLREDRAVPGLTPELAVANAPQADGTSFVVPKVIEGDEG